MKILIKIIKRFQKDLYKSKGKEKTGVYPVLLQKIIFDNNNYLLAEPPPPKLKMADRAIQLIEPSLEIPL